MHKKYKYYGQCLKNVFKINESYLPCKYYYNARKG